MPDTGLVMESSLGWLLAREFRSFRDFAPSSERRCNDKWRQREKIARESAEQLANDLDALFAEQGGPLVDIVARVCAEGPVRIGERTAELVPTADWERLNGELVLNPRVPHVEEFVDLISGMLCPRRGRRARVMGSPREFDHSFGRSLGLSCLATE